MLSRISLMETRWHVCLLIVVEMICGKDLDKMSFATPVEY